MASEPCDCFSFFFFLAPFLNCAQRFWDSEIFSHRHLCVLQTLLSTSCKSRVQLWVYHRLSLIIIIIIIISIEAVLSWITFSVFNCFCEFSWTTSLALKVNARMSEWMRGWVSEWVSEWVNAWMSEWVNAWMNEWVNEWMSEWVIAWMNEWVNECMDGWTLNSFDNTLPLNEFWIELISARQCVHALHHTFHPSFNVDQTDRFNISAMFLPFAFTWIDSSNFKK